MNQIVIDSTLLLTILLAVGLFFFIRASVKDRTQQLQLVSYQPQATLLAQLQQYFESRAYQLIAVDAQTDQVTYQGEVRPSWFLALFLSTLAAIGLLCLALVWRELLPQGGNFYFLILLFAPTASWFYWRGAGRTEQVKFKVEPCTDETNSPQNLVTIVGHRDELIQMQQNLSLTPLEG